MVKDVAVGAPRSVPQHFCSPDHQGASDVEVLGLRIYGEMTLGPV